MVGGEAHERGALERMLGEEVARAEQADEPRQPEQWDRQPPRPRPSREPAPPAQPGDQRTAAQHQERLLPPIPRRPDRRTLPPRCWRAPRSVTSLANPSRRRRQRRRSGLCAAGVVSLAGGASIVPCPPVGTLRGVGAPASRARRVAPRVPAVVHPVNANGRCQPHRPPRRMVGTTALAGAVVPLGMISDLSPPLPPPEWWIRHPPIGGPIPPAADVDNTPSWRWSAPAFPWPSLPGQPAPETPPEPLCGPVGRGGQASRARGVRRLLALLRARASRFWPARCGVPPRGRLPGRAPRRPRPPRPRR